MKTNKDDCKYQEKDGVYYMKCKDEKIPVDIDAPPMFRANVEEIVKDAVELFVQSS